MCLFLHTHAQVVYQSLNQRVHGSSPCAPTIEINGLSIELGRAIGAAFDADPMRTHEAGIHLRRSALNAVALRIEIAMDV
jgi:hypothetical protein